MGKTEEKSRFVLIDDDELFCDIMANYAKLRDIPLDYYLSLSEMGSIGRLSQYHVAIVDFDLGQMNGIEIAEYLPVFFGGMPLVLISATEKEHLASDKWPESIKAFVHKGSGPSAILDKALEVAQRFVRTDHVTPPEIPLSS